MMKPQLLPPPRRKLLEGSRKLRLRLKQRGAKKPGKRKKKKRKWNAEGKKKRE